MVEENYPKLRHPIDIRHEIVEDKNVLIIRCPIGISDEGLGFIPDILPILSCFDGTKSVSAIASQYADQGATEEIVKQLADLLDKHLFLDNDNYRKRYRDYTKAFTELDSRQAALAGGAYHSNGQQLIQELNSYLALADKNTKQGGELIGLVAPHIDYRRGHTCYGKTYAHLENQNHDLYLLIGTSHQYSDYVFHLTKKHFESPLGSMKCDVDFVQELADSYGVKRSYSDEFLHKQEHSLELQVPFLKHIQPDTKIAPILVGSFHNFLLSGKPPQHFEPYEALAEGLTSALKKRILAGQKICFIAGVDMAHVGRVFGDEGSLSEERMQHIAARDKVYIEAITEQNKEKLFEHIAEDNDARRICGYPSMYLTLDVLSRLGIRYSAQVYDYSQAVDFKTDCAVTYAGIGLYA